MAEHGDLSDPSYEPTDEELSGLMRRAFADVKERNEASRRAVRAQIASARVEAMRKLRAAGP